MFSHTVPVCVCVCERLRESVCVCVFFCLLYFDLRKITKLNFDVFAS
jgi:hypothetical protein